MGNITIEKYLIINSNREVLVFLRDNNDITNVFLPRRTKYAQETISFQKSMYNLLKCHLLEGDNRVFLYRQPLYDYPDNKGESSTHDVINKEYYVCLSDFNDDLVTKINTICNEYGILPYLIPLGTLKDRAWRNTKIPREKRKYAIDVDLPKPIKILKYKLDYVEY